QIFPNPVGDKLTFDFGKVFLSLRLEISDITGRIVYTEDIRGDKSYLPVQNIKNGIYFITLYEANKPVKTEKIIVQHP
ncbi:MAG: T9SS type A sorting domain-containing protein, partial [Bacteroidia bacterium]|nr:T9SS type A sorting domain-containing protein [Bacteroidia bacterium]